MTTHTNLINLHDPDAIHTRRPLLITHRGGVIAPDAPENSHNAIDLAAHQGYDMVELDVRAARDGEPVLFHGFGRGNLLIDCGVAAEVHTLTSGELAALRYRGTDQSILTLQEGLRLCAALNLGIMLDLKTDGHAPLATPFLERIAELLDAYCLMDATLTICSRPEVRKVFGQRILHRATEREAEQVRSGARESLAGWFWFGGPEEITDPEIAWLQQQGALVIPCINTFRYPHHSFGQLERADIARLHAANVDGYQIDSVYSEHFEKLQSSAA
jgi:hypothetical protein